MADKKATRQGYGDGLVELGKKYENVLVLEGDLGHATGTFTFRKAFPERHIEAGIAEQNLIGMAVGLSLNTLFAISEVLDVPAYKLLQLDS